MDFEHFVGISYDISSTMAFNQYYDMVIDELGYENVSRCVPFTLEELREFYAEDKYMNQRQEVWCDASGVGVSDKTGGRYIKQSPLRDLLRKNGITLWSQAEAVCLLKRCAERMVTEHD